MFWWDRQTTNKTPRQARALGHAAGGWGRWRDTGRSGKALLIPPDTHFAFSPGPSDAGDSVVTTNPFLTSHGFQSRGSQSHQWQ